MRTICAALLLTSVAAVFAVNHTSLIAQTEGDQVIVLLPGGTPVYTGEGDLLLITGRSQGTAELLGECRDLWLIDPHEGSCSDPGQPAALDDLLDATCELGSGELFFWLGKAQIGEHIAGARRHGDVSLLRPCS